MRRISLGDVDGDIIIPAIEVEDYIYMYLSTVCVS